MAYNGSGVFSIINTFVYDTVISETAVNQNFTDIATGLSTAITKDGQTVVTADIPMASNKFTGLAAGSAATDSANLGQIQAGGYIWCGTMTGTADAGVLSPTPAITAYAAGQRFMWKASTSANTTAMTVAISGLATIAVQNDRTALVSGNHAASDIYMGVLDTTSTMQIMKLADTGDMLAANNLSDVASAATARVNLSIAIQSWSGILLKPADQSYKLVIKCPFAGTITETTTMCASGTATATFKINTTALGGTANAISNTEQSQAHASANAFSVGDDIQVTISSNSSCVDASFTIEYTR